MNETNADGGEQILWNQLAERDEVNAQLRARIAELERELSEHKDEWDRLEMTVEEAHALRDEVERLKAELAYLKLQRDALLEITWLDLPDEPDESTKRWRDLFNAGWERKEVSEELRTQIEALNGKLTAAILGSQAEVERLTKERDEARAELWQETKNRPGLYGQLLQMKTQLAEREEDRWQPIATAPKDGTKVLIWSYGPGIEDGYWCDTKVPKGWSAGSNCPRSPQYWQPLPQPPAIRAARAQPEDGK